MWLKIFEVNSKSWDKLETMTASECTSVIGDSAGKSLYKALQNDYYKTLIQQLKPIFPFS